jgi:E3 SUMO-protein ligase PIAS1
VKVAAADDDIEMGDVSMGLKCPLGAMRMTAPVRSSVCVHMQCFDALSFLSLNEQTPSWQCPICDKTINPESLFLDGYVLDILEKVPDDEETVLVDAQGKWHTPNKKFSSEGDEMPKTPPRPVAQPQAVNTGNTASESGTELPPTSPPLPAVDTRDESQNKKVVEVFEIDDDDDSPLPKEKSWQQQQAQMQAQTQEQMEALKQNKITTATEKAREEMQRAREKGSPLANLQRLPSNSIMNGNGSGGIGRASSSREPSQSRMSNIEQFMNGRPSGIALKESPALPSPGLPSTTAAAPKPVVDVIDLTLSDSDDEGPMPPPRRRQTSTSNGPAPPPRATSSSSLSRPPSLPSIPQNGFSRFATSSSTPLNGLPGRPRETSLTNGSTDAFPPSRPSNGIHKPTPPPPRPIPAQSIPQPSPRRRSFSPEEGDYTDEDDSQPIIRKRKRLRSRNFVDSEEGEFHSSAERSSSSGGSSSERLYEEERAGLAVR